MLLQAGSDPRYITDIGESIFDALAELRRGREAIEAVFAEHGVTRDGDGAAGSDVIE
jgi:hypothetical protein